MKKFLMVLAFASVSVAGMAQSETPELKHSVATNSFWSNWFIQANLAGTAFYSSQENNLDLSKSPLKDFRSNLGLSVAIGKWFTPGLGLRTKVNGFWGRTVSGDDAKANANKYWQANEQVLFNLSNMICGYNPDRVWNFIPYIGGGIGRNMSYNSYAMGLQAGLLNEFRLSRKVALNLDLSWGMHEPDFDGNGAVIGASSHSPKAKDRDLNLEIGLTYNLGKATWNKVPDVDAINALHQSQLDALNAQLADANAENDRLNDLIKNHKCPEAKPVPVKEVASIPVSVFFNINKSKIASRKDLQNVKAMTEANKDAKFVVTGYADSRTGSAAYNQALSQKRAETVANELVKMGVSRDNIEIVAKGGVADLTPISYNRRATIEIK
jgi:outer membrane protein OmpA-like peptidoglycan-associated protein